MTSFSLNFDAAQNMSNLPARSSDSQSGEPTGDEFVATLAALWFVPPVPMPPVAAETVSAEPAGTTGAPSEPANAAALSDPAACGDQISALRQSIAGIADLLKSNIEPAPTSVATITITNPITPSPLLIRATDSFAAAPDAFIKASFKQPSLQGLPTDAPLPLKLSLPVNPLSGDAAPDAVATTVNPPAETLTINLPVAGAQSPATGLNDRGSSDTARGEDPLVGHPIDANSAPRLQPRHVNDQAAQVSDAMASRTSLNKINSLISMAIEQPGATITANQESFAQNKLRQRAVESSNSELVQNEKTAQASLLGTMFRELVGDPMTESQPSSHALKVDPAALSTSPGAGSTDDNSHAFDHMTQTDAGSLALASGNPAALRGATGAGANSTSAALAPQIIDPMIEMARSLSPQQTRSLRIQLQPDKFGQIELKITRDVSGRLSAHLMTQSTVTRHALTEGISSLRDALEQCGLMVDRLDVSLALNSDGKPGSQTASDREAGTASLPTARLFATESSAIGDAQPATRTEPRRLLNLRI